MQTTGNTILITGGGTGIGRGLAEAFHALGNRVIISGRRMEALEKTIAANPGIEALSFDIQDPAGIRDLAERVTAEYPALNVLINNAGVMRREDLREPQPGLDDAEAMITTNLLGPLRLTSALLPLLRKQPHSAVMNVSSGLAFLPLSMTPTYCATKAAIHSYTESLRYQLQGTTTEVLELIPPYVQTDLMDGAADPRAMPLRQFIDEVMAIVESQPSSGEICVERVKQLRFAAETGRYDAVFKGFNDAMSGH